MSARPPAPPHVGFRPLLASFLDGHRHRGDLLLAESIAKGGMLRIPIPRLDIFLVTSPTAVRHVLVDNAANYEKSPDYAAFKPLIGNGLITADPLSWARDRPLVQPRFRGGCFRSFLPEIDRIAADAVAEMAAGQPLDIARSATRYALRVISQWALGLELREESDLVGELLTRCQQAVVQKGNRIVQVDLPFSREERGWRRDRARLVALIDELIARSRAEASGALVHELIEQGVPADRLRDHVVTFYLAGHETTAVALTWMCYALAAHPQAQQATRASLATDGAYLDAAISESLRLYPAISFFGRSNLEDDVVDGYPVKAAPGWASAPTPPSATPSTGPIRWPSRPSASSTARPPTTVDTTRSPWAPGGASASAWPGSRCAPSSVGCWSASRWGCTTRPASRSRRPCCPSGPTAPSCCPWRTFRSGLGQPGTTAPPAAARIPVPISITR